ncbi:Uncharacterised protein [Mycobacterium tuberculosis]|nr:Uncharacterised protein [Mycobacterium tuberculosis]
MLKNPDDGAVVVLPNPGTAGTSMIGIGISPMRMVPSKVAGTVSRVNPSGNSVNASSPTDSPVTPAEARGKVSPPGKKVNPSLATSIPTVTGVCAGMVKPFGKSVHGVVSKLRVRGIGVGVTNI